MTRPARQLTLIDCFGLGINGILGSGIFLLPAASQRRAGSHSPLAWLVAGSLCTLIALCFAEAASRTSVFPTLWQPSAQRGCLPNMGASRGAAKRNIPAQTLVGVVSVSGRCGPYTRSGELNAALRKNSFRFSQVASPRVANGESAENRIYLQVTNNVRDLAWKKRSDHTADADTRFAEIRSGPT